MKSRLPGDALAGQSGGDQPAEPGQHLPVPIPPETEYSVLVPITVDRVGINKHLERGSVQ